MSAAALERTDLLSEIPKLGKRAYPLWQERLAKAKDAADLDNVILIGVGNKTLVDANGQLPVGEEYVMVKADEEGLKSVWEEGNTKVSVLYPGKEGRLYKSAYAPVMTEAGKVVAVIRVEASAKFLDIVNRAGVILLVSALIMTAMAALLGMLIARSIVIPIKQLVRASQRIADGDLDTEVFIRSSDEIGFFARTFNQMSRNLKKLYQEVEARGKQIVELSASVAHEVRSPISAIQGFTELLEDDMDHDDPGLEYIADIKNEIKILSSKITDFINFARPLEIEPIPSDINEILDSALVSMDKEVTDSGVSVVTNFGSDLPAVQGDFDQLRGLFVNLIRNAVQAMDGGGGMVISARTTNDDMQDVDGDPNCVEIRIEDTGCGMDPGAVEHAFEPFFTTKGSGTGLGLAIVKKIVDVHNGKIELKSDVGRGTTVKVFLPISKSIDL
jgi:signal transduction histidine kinase